MYEIKVNLIMTLPGRIMMSEQECLRKVRKPLMGKGKKANKQVIDKNGNPVWHTVLEANPAKTDRFQIDFVDKNGNIVSDPIMGSNDLEGWKAAVAEQLKELQNKQEN